MHRLVFTFFSLFILAHFSLSCQTVDNSFYEIRVDLKNPIYSDGILSTTQGGVIQTSNLRIQAQCLTYINQQKETNQERWSIDAKGDLIFEFGDYLFIGDHLHYDLKTQTGILRNGKTSSGPWFFGGEEFQLREDGSYFIVNGYVTTSERDCPEWGIYSETVFVEKDHCIQTKEIQLRFFNFPLLWIPSWRANLDSIFDSPIRYRFRWGGQQGPRFGFTYEIFSWRNWKTFARFDYRLTRGPGGGIETHYHSDDLRTQFNSINYLSMDSSLLHLDEKCRYRFEGNFRKFFKDDHTSLLITYDKISDKDMPNCYYDQDFFIVTSYRTQFLLRHRQKNWISSFYSRVQINPFQTVKQELPTLSLNFKPIDIDATGLIFENNGNVSYLDFAYSHHLPHVHNYHSSRIDYHPVLYRPFTLTKGMTLTPEISAIAICYSNSPQHQSQYLLQGRAQAHLQTYFYRRYSNFKHVVEPYLTYSYFSTPTSSPNHHYIFDISDGITHLNAFTLGFKQSVYQSSKCLFNRPLYANIYTYAFLNTRKFKRAFPRLYADVSWYPIKTLHHTFAAAWNNEINQLDYINIKSEWTLNEDFALSTEFRHRGSYSWRKVDPHNFFLDLYRSEKALRHSQVSDRRDTLLLHFFYRFHPNWVCEFTSRQGWNRHREPNYIEYEIDFLTTIQTAWNLRLSFQHQENDNRIALYLNVGLSPPDLKKCTKVNYFN